MENEKRRYPRFFDSHTHYNDPKFASVIPGGSLTLLDGLLETTLTGAILVGTNPKTNREVTELASAREHLWAAVGIHPEDCHYLSGNPESAVADLSDFLDGAADSEPDKTVAIGEIGLDYHWPEYDGIPMNPERQKAFFHLQLELAKEKNLPVIIHDRDAHGDCMEVLTQHRGVRGVLHSFSGSAEMARELVRLGWYLSFSGPITYHNARKSREALAAIPRDRILIETDCPYLPPVPHRGQINHSGLLIHTAEAMAEVLKLSVEQVAGLTEQNAQDLFFSGRSI